MIENVEWKTWAPRVLKTRGGEILGAAVEALLNEAKVAALWVSGSRATDRADEHSDVDIRIHAPGWSEADFEQWLGAVQREPRVRWRLSKLGPAVWNYECLFAGSVPVDLLVFAAEQAPVVSVDSVVFKGGSSLNQADASLVVKESPLGRRERQALVDGAEIDLQKFEKLSARGERLAAWFLLEVARFSAVRLAYVAVRGKDCGPKPMHTLASIKVVRQRIRDEGGVAGREWCAALEAEGTLEEAAARVATVTRAVAGKVLAEDATDVAPGLR